MHMRVKKGEIFIDQHGVAQPKVEMVHDNDPAFDKNRLAGVLEHWTSEVAPAAPAPAEAPQEPPEEAAGEGEAEEGTKKTGRGRRKAPKE